MAPAKTSVPLCLRGKTLPAIFHRPVYSNTVGLGGNPIQ